MSVKYFNGAEYFNLGELIELGRRLTDQQLKKMKLLEAVIQAEQEYLWRLRSISDLARDCSGRIYFEIQKELILAEKFAIDPKRVRSHFIGRTSSREKRSLPEPGTLIIREYKYQHPWPERMSMDGSTKRVSSETFRFVVVDTPSTLLRFGDESGIIYKSVSRAASAATGSSTDGWRFFEIF